MESMTHRERFLTALNLQETDRVPLDFGGTTATTIILPAYEKLKKYLGVEHRTQLMAKWGRTVVPDDKILEMFDIDTRPLLLGEYKGGLSKVLDENSFIDAWGTTWAKAPDGHFINANGVFQNCDPEMALLETHDWPDPNNPGLYEGLRERAEWLRNTSDCAIVLNVPVGIVHQCQFMRGFAEYLTDLYLNPEFACRMMDIIVDIWSKIVKNALDAVGKNVDVISWADDVAMQESTFMSPETYRDLIKPRHKRMVEASKTVSEAKVRYHSCGAVYPLIEDFIEIGIDALNPIQISAHNMNPAALKEEFGSRLAFWGAIDTQRLLPFGTPAEVSEGAREMIACLGKGGGYVLASVHNIQAEVPPENVVAMFEAARL